MGGGVRHGDRVSEVLGSEDVSDAALKRCTKCGEEKPATTEYFMAQKDRGVLRADCRECQRASARQWKQEHADEVRAYSRQYYAEHAQEIREKARQYHQQHIEERREQGRQWRKANPDKKKEGYQRWLENNPDYHRQWRAEHRDAIRERQRERYAQNPDAYRERVRKWRSNNPEYFARYNKEHKEHKRKFARQYNIEHPEKTRAHTQKRRALAALSEGSHSAADIRAQVNMQKDKKGRLRCWWCSKEIKGDNNYHVDHRIPLSKGGSNAPENLCISCPSCNLSKGAKLPQEWNGRLL